MSRILSVSSSRADVGILQPVWRALAGSGAALDIVLTGMHRAPDAPGIELTGIDAATHRVGSDLGGRGDAGAASAMASIVADCGALYERVQPDAVLVIGDRLDMLPAAVATLPFNLPLAHLHGGEVTEGAIDDRIRHALTKLAHLHLASCRSAADRIRDMGEEGWRIVVTGAPGLDTLRAAPQLSRAAFLAETGLDRVAGSNDRFLLVTVHPETNSQDFDAPLSAVLAALDELRIPVLFTAPNNDPGGAELRRRIDLWLERNAFATMVPTLGSRRYASALRHAGAMLGNSSSGIVEAGLFGLPVVNVGDRQKGREAGGNVVHVPNDGSRVRDAITAALRRRERVTSTPYGDGFSAPRIAASIEKFLREPRLKQMRKATA